MKNLSKLMITLGLFLAVSAQAEAQGCLKGAMMGAAAGHVAHHAVMGAVGGCVVAITWPVSSKKKLQPNSSSKSNRQRCASGLTCWMQV